MAGLGAAEAEVIDGSNQAGAEQMVPEAVDGDAGGKWIVLAGDPGGELEAAAREIGNVEFVGAGEGDSRAGGGFAELVRVAADVHLTVGGGFGVLHGVGGGGDDGEILIELDGLGGFLDLFIKAFGFGGVLFKRLAFGAQECELFAGGVEIGPVIAGFGGAGGELFGQFGEDDGIDVAEDAEVEAAGEGAGAGEDAGHAVVVVEGDGIELMIMAAGAAEGKAEHGAADQVELEVDDVHAELLFVGVDEGPGAEDEQAGSD